MDTEYETPIIDETPLDEALTEANTRLREYCREKERQKANEKLRLEQFKKIRQRQRAKLRDRIKRNRLHELASRDTMIETNTFDKSGYPAISALGHLRSDVQEEIFKGRLIKKKKTSHYL